MTESRVRSAVGVFLVFTQIFVILFAVVLRVLGGLRFEDLTTALSLIVPMFAVHTTAVVKYFAKHRTDVDTPSSKVTSTFTLLAFFVPVCFAGYLFGVLSVKAWGIAFGAPEEFKWALGVGQTCFAVYIATFIESLFDEGGHVTGGGRKLRTGTH